MECGAIDFAERCERCGAVIPEHRQWWTALYCSMHCKRASHWALEAEALRAARREARKGKVCPGCGRTFDAPRIACQVYCTPQCSKRYRRRRAKNVITVY